MVGRVYALHKCDIKHFKQKAHTKSPRPYIFTKLTNRRTCVEYVDETVDWEEYVQTIRFQRVGDGGSPAADPNRMDPRGQEESAKRE